MEDEFPLAEIFIPGASTVSSKTCSKAIKIVEPSTKSSTNESPGRVRNRTGTETPQKLEIAKSVTPVLESIWGPWDFKHLIFFVVF